jgi:hypothetical protein
MRSICVFFAAIAALSAPSSLLTQAQPPRAAETSPAQAAAGEGGCRSYYTIEPLDQSVLRLLGTPPGRPSQIVFASAAYQQLREWNFPGKVTRWSERPSPDELARRRDELGQPSSSARQGDDQSRKSPTPAPAGFSKPYELQPFSPKDWKDLEKWFVKEAPKKLPGVCVDRDQASYVLAIGIISDGNADRSLENSSTRNEYGQSTTVRQQDSGIGPNGPTFSPQLREPNPQELSGLGLSDAAANTCAYVYRTNGKPLGQGGLRQDAPDYYYCKSGGIVPRSAVTTMLKYLAQTDHP